MPQPDAPALPSKPWKNWAVLAVALLLTAGGLAGLHLLLRPAPEVRTLIQVPLNSPMFPIRGEAAPDRATHQRNQMAIVKSRGVLNSALNDERVKNLPLVAEKLEQLEWLEKEVQADFSVAPDIMKISMRGSN